MSRRIVSVHVAGMATEILFWVSALFFWFRPPLSLSHRLGKTIRWRGAKRRAMAARRGTHPPSGRPDVRPAGRDTLVCRAVCLNSDWLWWLTHHLASPSRRFVAFSLSLPGSTRFLFCPFRLRPSFIMDGDFCETDPPAHAEAAASVVSCVWTLIGVWPRRSTSFHFLFLSLSKYFYSNFGIGLAV